MDQFLSPIELSRLLKVSKPWPYVMVKRGLIPHYKMGKHEENFRRLTLAGLL